MAKTRIRFRNRDLEAASEGPTGVDAVQNGSARRWRGTSWMQK